ncbi:Subtilisin-like protease SDD1 [Platanthera zijinensis]|uniref:Subtilisin-like protease SDD1 n=1 Tax=Platanthera zijinensis TaxID=2320716 RepID=A0AAP0G8H1_9ASPA
MATLILTLFISFLVALIFLSFPNPSSSSQLNNHSVPLQSYIIFVKQPAENSTHTTQAARDNWYESFLPFTTFAFRKSRILRTYSSAISGFVAKLSADELHQVSLNPSFLTAIPNRQNHRLFTTHSPAFLGLNHVDGGLWNYSNYGAGIIIGILDTGIHPGHPSFSDQAMPNPPSKWKGRCQFQQAGACNKKLIGARFHSVFNSDSPDDDDGHGTHVSATAAGAFVPDANFLSSSYGTAAGVAPLAHLAMYKICGKDFCTDDAILDGIDSAINDGVDVISISLGEHSRNFYDSITGIGSFKAIRKGIFVSCAAGNDGPEMSTVTNDAPWILTVGASTTDRNVRATVKLGSGEELDGESVFQPKSGNDDSSLLPLVFPDSGVTDDGSMNCSPETLRAADVRGKSVFCYDDRSGSEIGRLVKEAGGASLILSNSRQLGYTTMAFPQVLPATLLSYEAGRKILSYINSTSNPTAAIIFKGTILGASPAPMMAGFSSRGPSLASPGILKPDIIGPGVNILAAWPFQVKPESPKSNITTLFNMISGTSMSAPHLSGIAALLKSVHPDWSPAAIKSAIMTTADTIGNDGYPIRNEQNAPASFFDTGAGHVDPTKAANPGLIYNLTVDDYTSYLCGLGYTNAQVEVITGTSVSCEKMKKISEAELNYPSIMAILRSDEGAELRRVVTNVGEERSSFLVQVEFPEGIEVRVEPEKLDFMKVGETKSFTVRIMTKGSGEGEVVQGSLKWVSDNHVVRSPVVVQHG